MTGANGRPGRWWLRRQRIRRTRLMVVVLLIGTVAVALLMADRYHLGVPQTTVAALIGGGSLATLYVAWATYRDDQARGELMTLAGIADQLASEIGKQWAAEAAARRLNDPYPLPVRWIPADPSLADSWAKICKLAVSGAGWPSEMSQAMWAQDPVALAGSGHGLRDVLTRVPTGRLVVLGEPGAGKTMLMVRLVLDLLARRQPGGPVPVLASLASWNPAEQALHEWLAAQMIAERLALASAAPPGAADGTVAEALLAAGLVLPVLDGLDEIPDVVRGSAISRINDALRPAEQLVLTCRTKPYQAAVRPPGDLEVTLRGAAAVQLLPLQPAVVAEYLQDDAGGPKAAARWKPVIDTLGTCTPAALALETPLMVGLARTIYNPRPGEHTAALRDPAELCDPALINRTAVERHLFDEFIPAAYRSGPGSSPLRWPAPLAEAWLVFLARHLDHTLCSADLAWWQLQQAVSPGAGGLILGLSAGLGTGLACGLAAGVGTGPAVGLAAAAAAMLAAGPAIGLVSARWRLPGRAQGIRWRYSTSSAVIGLSAGLGTMLTAGLTFGLSSGLSSGLTAGLVAGYGPGLASGLAIGLAVGLVSARWRLPTPIRGVRWRYSTGSVTAGIVAGTAAGLGTGLTYGLRAGPAAGLTYGPAAGLAVGVAIGLAVGLEGVQPDLTAAASPTAVLKRDRHAALVVGLGVGLGIGMTAGLGFSPVIGLFVGTATGFAFGLIVTMLKTAWPSYSLIRGWLAFRRRLPWALMGFLADAHRRGVLRQVGTVYQFRHIELQHQLASRPGPSRR